MENIMDNEVNVNKDSIALDILDTETHKAMENHEGYGISYTLIHKSSMWDWKIIGDDSDIFEDILAAENNEEKNIENYM